LSIVIKNILDATKSEDSHQISAMDRMKRLFLKKDPLLQVVLYENAITLTSSSIPLIFSGKLYNRKKHEIFQALMFFIPFLG